MLLKLFSRKPNQSSVSPFNFNPNRQSSGNTDTLTLSTRSTSSTSIGAPVREESTGGNAGKNKSSYFDDTDNDRGLLFLFSDTDLPPLEPSPPLPESPVIPKDKIKLPIPTMKTKPLNTITFEREPAVMKTNSVSLLSTELSNKELQKKRSCAKQEIQEIVFNAQLETANKDPKSTRLLFEKITLIKNLCLSAIKDGTSVKNLQDIITVSKYFLAHLDLLETQYEFIEINQKVKNRFEMVLTNINICDFFAAQCRNEETIQHFYFNLQLLIDNNRYHDLDYDDTTPWIETLSNSEF